MMQNLMHTLPVSSEEMQAWLATNPPIEHKREVAKAKERQRALDASRSLIAFTQHVTPDYVAEQAHELIASHLDRVVRGECKRLLIVAPRRHGKSRLASETFPAYWLLHHPNEPVILASYAATLAETFGRRAREIVASDKWAQLTPLRLSKASQSVSDWKLQGHRGGMYSVGVGGGITGLTAGILLWDDLYAGWAEAYSETVREHTWEWYGHTFRHPLIAGGPIVGVTSRWIEDDVAGRIIADMGEREPWEIVRLPALGETQAERDARNKINGLPAGLPGPAWQAPGEPLCPKLFDMAALESIRNAPGMTPQAWESEYMGAPTAPEGSIIRREWLRYYTEPPDMVYDSVLCSWDCAFKDASTSDYVVGVVLARKGAKIWLLDMVRDRLDFPATCKAIKALRSKWPIASLVLVEDAANGTAVVQALRDEVGGIVAVKPLGGKASRLSAVSHMFEAGQVYFPEHAYWLDDCVHELTSFPAAAHDDIPDALSQGLSRFMDVKPLSAEQEADQAREDARRLGFEERINRLAVMVRTAGYPEARAKAEIERLRYEMEYGVPPPAPPEYPEPSGWQKPRDDAPGYIGRKDGQ